MISINESYQFKGYEESWFVEVGAMIKYWEPVATAPNGRDLELSVIEAGEVHSLAFPCRKEGKEWVDSATGARVAIDPTHWHGWNKPTSE